MIETGRVIYCLRGFYSGRKEFLGTPLFLAKAFFQLLGNGIYSWLYWLWLHGGWDDQRIDWTDARTSNYCMVSGRDLGTHLRSVVLVGMEFH